MDQDIQRLFDERECEKLISEYCRLVDFGNAAGIAQLFVSDGIWTGPGVEMIGQSGIEAGFTARQAITRRQSRHL